MRGMDSGDIHQLSLCEGGEKGGGGLGFRDSELYVVSFRIWGMVHETSSYPEVWAVVPTQD